MKTVNTYYLTIMIIFYHVLILTPVGLFPLACYALDPVLEVMHAK